MSGRFVADNQAAIEREFTIVQPLWIFAPSYNVVRLKPSPVIRVQDGRRAGLKIRWG